MKKVFVYLQGMAWRTVGGTDVRSLLMSCRTPTLRALARQGRLGSFPIGDAAHLRQTGLMPAFFQGAPGELLRDVQRGGLEAAGINGLPEERFWYRADFVAMDDDAILDPAVRGLTEPETRALAESLHDVWQEHDIVALVAEAGHLLLGLTGDHGAMTVGQAPWLRMEEEPMPPLRGMVGRTTLVALETKIREKLHGHDINQVRVDLGENPANALCLWGGGRCPDPISRSAHASSSGSGAVWAPGAWGRGLAGWLGLAPLPGVSPVSVESGAAAFSPARAVEALRQHDTLLIPVDAPEFLGMSEEPAELAAYLERCDRLLLAPLLEVLAAHRPWRVLLVADAPPFASGDADVLGTALALLAGEGVVPDDAAEWHEEACMNGGMGSITLDSLLKTFMEV